MNDLARKGKFFTIVIFVSGLLASIYHCGIYVFENGYEKLLQRIIPVYLEVLIMYFIFKGKQWAVAIYTILCSIALIMGLVLLFMHTSCADKAELIVLTLINGLTAYLLIFSKSFKEYFHYLQHK